jgi:sugar O-acyltransferase (sialic acid O-acetyltransferase NeuD family)
MERRATSAIIWGATGQAKVVRQILAGLGIEIACICDRDPAVPSPIPTVPIWHTEEEFLAWLGGNDPEALCFVAAIGGAGGASRLAVHAYLRSLDIEPVLLVHPRAWVDSTASLGSGDQVLAMAAIGVDASVGAECIVNTGATVDHDTRLGDGAHVMPGATIAGQVVIGDEVVIGTGATVLPNLTIGSRALVGAGAVVTHDVAPGTTVVGVPARPVGMRAAPPRTAGPWSFETDASHESG